MKEDLRMMGKKERGKPRLLRRLLCVALLSVMILYVFDVFHSSKSKNVRSIASRDKARVKVGALVTPPQPAAQRDGDAFSTGLFKLQGQSKNPWVPGYTQLSAKRFIKTLKNGRYSLSGNSMDSKARKFIDEYSESLFGVSGDSLIFQENDQSNPTRVTYQQTLQGIPIHSRRLYLFIDGDTLVRVQNDLIHHQVQVSEVKVTEKVNIKELKDIIYRLLGGERKKMDPSALGDPSSPEAFYISTSNYLVLAYRTVLSIKEFSHPRKDMEIFLDQNLQRILRARNLIVH